MSSWYPKDLHIYSRFQKYTSKLLRGSKRHYASRTMDVSPRSMHTSIVRTKGLSNNSGENNCFLNSAVQILWHLDVFRKNFNLISHHACLENSCIFCALKVIFTQFAFGEEQVMPPYVLRKALAVAFKNQQKFQMGLMDDAAECFEHILTRMHFHLSNGDVGDHCTVPHCISHQKFAMMLIEQVICTCGETSEPLPFVQLVHYVSAHSIIELAQLGMTKSFGQMLRLAHTDGNLRNQCPNNCGELTRTERTLTNSPDVVSIGLIWDSDEQSTDQVRKFLEAIGTELCLVELFDSAVDTDQAGAAKQHKLVGMVCYYGKHYSAFLLHSKTGLWVSCDDAQVTDIGSKWKDVVEKCSRGRYQPLLLLYQNPNASLISERSLPTKTTMLTSDDVPKGGKAATSDMPKSGKAATSDVPKGGKEATSDMPKGNKAAAAAEGKRGAGKPGKTTKDPSSVDSEPGNCSINNNNSVLDLNGISFDHRPTITPSAPPTPSSSSGTKPPIARPSGGPSAKPPGPSVVLPRPSVTPYGPSNLQQIKSSQVPRPVQSGSSHSLPRSSDSVAKHPSSHLLANSIRTGSYSCIPTQHPNPPLYHHQQQHQPHLNATHVTQNACNASNSPGRGVIGNSPYQHGYDVLPNRPGYVVYNEVTGPLNHLPYQPGPVPPVMSSHGPSFSTNFHGPGIAPNSSCGLAPPSGYGQAYHSGWPNVAVPSTGANLQAVPVTSPLATSQLDSVGRDRSIAGNQSVIQAPNEGRLTDDVITRSGAPSSEMNLMDWSIIDERTLPSPDSDSTSSQYDNLLDFLSIDDKASCQMAPYAVNGAPLVTRNESLTDSYFVVPDAQYLDAMASGKDLTKDADQLIEQSEAKEKSGDMHAALICCNQATNLYAMARKDPSNRAGNGEMGALKEKIASSRSKRLLQQIEYNQQKSKSDAAKNKFMATSGIPPQTVTSPTKTSEQDLLIFLEDSTQSSYVTPQYKALLDNLPQLYSPNCGGSRYHWISK